MNKKKFIVIIGIFIIVIITIAVLIIYINKNNNKCISSEDIFKKINNQETFVIYATTNDATCDTCKDIENAVNFFQEAFKINFVFYYIDENTNEDLEKIENYFQYQEKFITDQTILIIKKGKLIYGINERPNEQEIKDLLIKSDLIDKKYSLIEKELNTDTDFNNIFNASTKSLIVVYSGNKIYKLKKQLYDLADKNKFKFYIFYPGFVSNFETYMELANKTFISMESSTLLIVKSGEIIDNYIYENEEDLNKFLKKNNFIK